MLFKHKGPCERKRYRALKTELQLKNYYLFLYKSDLNFNSFQLKSNYVLRNYELYVRFQLMTWRYFL